MSRIEVSAFKGEEQIVYGMSGVPPSEEATTDAIVLLKNLLGLKLLGMEPGEPVDTDELKHTIAAANIEVRFLDS